MSQDPQQASPLFTQFDISAGTRGDESTGETNGHASEQTELLHQILAAADRQTELLEELVASSGAAQRQRNNELTQWRRANPHLASSCRHAAEALAQVQSEFLSTLTAEIEDNAEDLKDGDFVFNEFVDRYGPRLAHLNGVLQMLSQLSAPQDGT